MKDRLGLGCNFILGIFIILLFIPIKIITNINSDLIDGHMLSGVLQIFQLGGFVIAINNLIRKLKNRK